jgi:hypothetical protein
MFFKHSKLVLNLANIDLFFTVFVLQFLALLIATEEEPDVLFNLVTSDRTSAKGLWAIKITRELWKRQIWTEAKALEEQSPQGFARCRDEDWEEGVE